MDFIRQRRVQARADNRDARLENVLSNLRDKDLPGDAEAFYYKHLKMVEGYTQHIPGLVELSGEEKDALVKERDSAFPEPGMFIVQSSINNASLFAENLSIDITVTNTEISPMSEQQHDPNGAEWILGAMNATPFFAAALIGCWMALPLSDRFGRKGSMQVAAILVLITSALMAGVPKMSTSVPKWAIVISLRLFNGIGMGIKAVNTPMLASECAVGYWRGTSVLAWQLWVACGIMIGFASNALFVLAPSPDTSLTFILGAPLLPALILFIVSLACPESPRYYMRRPGTKNYSPAQAYNILKRLRRCELIALRDIYVLHNTSVVALSQQMCGSAVNFIFGLPAIRYIDVIGRRKWLITTLLPMAGLLGAASESCIASTNDAKTTRILVILSLYLHAAFYSPGLGPVPFTLAAESFPLTHREAGCAFAISLNLFFAGLLSLLFPRLLFSLRPAGALGLFAGPSMVAFVLVFLVVEETKQKSLEDLDFVFGVPKRDFMRFQISKYLPWVFRRHLPWILWRYLPWCMREYLPQSFRFHVPRHDREQKLESGVVLRNEKPPKPQEPVLYSTDEIIRPAPLSSDNPRA
ncbi:hypothetical protein SCUP515_02769 [Seiridium cupressi]